LDTDVGYFELVVKVTYHNKLTYVFSIFFYSC
jgi:hypothetical protein